MEEPRLKINFDLSPPGKKGHDEHYYECMICDNGGQLLCCETCPGTYQLECLNPPLKSIPTGDWPCAQCCYRDPTSKKKLIKLNIGGSKSSVQMAGSDKLAKKKIKLNIEGSKTAVQTVGNVKPSLIFGSANHGASVSRSRGEIRNKCKSGTSPPSLLPCKAYAIISLAFDGNKNASKRCFAGKVDPCLIFCSSVSHFNDKSSTL